MEIKKLYDSLIENDSEKDIVYLEAAGKLMNSENPMKIDFNLFTEEYLKEIKEQLIDNFFSYRRNLLVASYIKQLPSVKSTEAIFI
jgi:hypothetical protein